jgi:hypothetical protein
MVDRLGVRLIKDMDDLEEERGSTLVTEITWTSGTGRSSPGGHQYLMCLDSMCITLKTHVNANVSVATSFSGSSTIMNENHVWVGMHTPLVDSLGVRLVTEMDDLEEERASENLNEGCSAKSNLERLLCNSRSSKVIADDYFKFVLACNRATGV